MKKLERNSPCKVNLLLNILGKRPDGFHELETVFHPVALCDRLEFSRGGQGIELSCNDPVLPVDAANLVHRAAARFCESAGIRDGIRIHLEKHVPLAAGLGGGSSNAANTLLALNELFGEPLPAGQLQHIAASLGSDVNFFLQNQPALAMGRGERIVPLEPFPALQGAHFLLIHPGFGISTAWAYRELARFPSALNGQAGRAQYLVAQLQSADLGTAGRAFYNSLEAPALEKFPVLRLYQEFLRNHGAAATLMSGSGSTTFALFRSQNAATTATALFKERFGANTWTAIVPV